MAIKRTDRVKIQQYGDDLGRTFTDISQSLEELVAGVAAANYEGGNAVQFKQGCLDSCLAFAESVQTAMTQMAGNVREQTSYIAGALGGTPIQVDDPVATMDSPAISTDDSIELADSDALVQMKGLISDQMKFVTAAFDRNLAAFNTLGTSDGWVGEEYDTLQGQMITTTDQVNGEVEAAASSLETTIDNQLQAVGL